MTIPTMKNFEKFEPKAKEMLAFIYGCLVKETFSTNAALCDAAGNRTKAGQNVMDTLKKRLEPISNFINNSAGPSNAREVQNKQVSI